MSVVARRKPWSNVKKGDYLVLSTGVEIVVTLVAPDPEANIVRISGRISYTPSPIKKLMYFGKHDPADLVSVIID